MSEGGGLKFEKKLNNLAKKQGAMIFEEMPMDKWPAVKIDETEPVIYPPKEITITSKTEKPFALLKERISRQNESINQKYINRNKFVKESPLEPEFRNLKYIPEQSVGEVLPLFDSGKDKLLGCIVLKKEHGDIIRIEYIGHTEEVTNSGEVKHIFCFRSEVRNPLGKVTDSVFFPSAPGELHPAKGGSKELNKWFLALQKLETKTLKVRNHYWDSYPDKKGYFSCTCFVPS